MLRGTRPSRARTRLRCRVPRAAPRGPRGGGASRAPSAGQPPAPAHGTPRAAAPGASGTGAGRSRGEGPRAVRGGSRSPPRAPGRGGAGQRFPGLLPRSLHTLIWAGQGRAISRAQPPPRGRRYRHRLPGPLVPRGEGTGLGRRRREEAPKPAPGAPAAPGARAPPESCGGGGTAAATPVPAPGERRRLASHGGLRGLPGYLPHTEPSGFSPKQEGAGSRRPSGESVHRARTGPIPHAPSTAPGLSRAGGTVAGHEGASGLGVAGSGPGATSLGSGTSPPRVPAALPLPVTHGPRRAPAAPGAPGRPRHAGGERRRPAGPSPAPPCRR
ncbi:collagen alpha-1(I) chain-like [Oxyura jamaicensis]|uniref:collagen alpha-1(I) chain-like n=1 Tax=Oxyura jamaicensis TaxID=8884 RepID=UPI0015A4F01C|nr:collagen alpha-1(I) chain-like [Oxyura jamaicensis]